MSTPAFQFYPKQWLGDDKVLLMDWAARGMHMHLMCIAWQQDPPCTIPDDDSVLKKWCGNPKQWPKLRDQILRAWKLTDGRWVQEGLLKEYLKQRKYSESRKAGAEARWGKPDARAYEMDSTSIALQSSSSSSSSYFIEDKKEKRVGSALPSPTNGTTKSKTIELADEEFIEVLKTMPAYSGIDIDQELSKFDAWLLTPKGRGKYKTKTRVVNWLNGAKPAMEIKKPPAMRAPSVNCHFSGKPKCLKQCWPTTNSERNQLEKEKWVCDQHKEVFAGQGNEDNISTPKTEDKSSNKALWSS